MCRDMPNKVKLFALATPIALSDDHLGRMELVRAEILVWSDWALVFLVLFVALVGGVVWWCCRDALKHRELPNRIFKELYDRNRDGLIICDMAGGILDANPAFCEMVGYEKSQLQQMTAWELTPENSREWELREVGGNEFLERGYSELYEREYIRRDGTVITAEVRANILSDSSGEPQNVWAMVRDVSDKKHGEGKYARMVKLLEERNSDLEQYVYSVSHDLKGPLITIRGFLGLLEGDLESGDKKRINRDMESIVSSVRKLQDLLSDLLELNRVGRMDDPLSEIPMSEVARHALDVVCESNDHRVSIEVEPNMPVMIGIHRRLVQLYIKLLENSMKFMCGQPDPRIEIGSHNVDGEEVFYVADNGPGIEPQLRDKAFELFSQLMPNQEGTGTGLTIAKRIVEIHGGRIWIDSGLDGRGISVCFILGAKR